MLSQYRLHVNDLRLRYIDQRFCDSLSEIFNVDIEGFELLNLLRISLLSVKIFNQNFGHSISALVDFPRELLKLVLLRMSLKTITHNFEYITYTGDVSSISYSVFITFYSLSNFTFISLHLIDSCALPTTISLIYLNNFGLISCAVV